MVFRHLEIFKRLHLIQLHMGRVEEQYRQPEMHSEQSLPVWWIQDMFKLWLLFRNSKVHLNQFVNIQCIDPNDIKLREQSNGLPQIGMPRKKTTCIQATYQYTESKIISSGGKDYYCFSNCQCNKDRFCNSNHRCEDPISAEASAVIFLCCIVCCLLGCGFVAKFSM